MSDNLRTWIRLVERRSSMLAYLKGLLPTWPDYIMKDWIYNLAKGNPGDFRNVKQTLTDMLDAEGIGPATKWTLVPNMRFTMQMMNPWTVDKLTRRSGGRSDAGVGVTNDAERHATQADLMQRQGGIRSEPVIMIRKQDGWELVEGWHRAIQHFALHPDGYSAPAWTATAR